MHPDRFIAIAALLLVSACATLHEAGTYKLYPGADLPDAELASLLFGSRVHAIKVDGLEVSAADYGEVKLLPGEHRIGWGATFGISVMVNPAMYDRADAEKTVTLAAGRRYKVEADRTTGRGYRMFLWIEDAESGEVIAGEKKPRR